MQDKRIALVTGANQGIGFQIAKELAAKNFTVLVGSRDFARGAEAVVTESLGRAHPGYGSHEGGARRGT